MLEIACFELTSAERALQSAADRIEFCTEIQEGGTTPKVEEFLYLKSNCSKPIFVMIRPKGGVFHYTESEFDQMKRSVLEFKIAGADGFVFGVLEPNSQIDVKRNAELISLAGGVPCTFHRAIDRTNDLFQSVQSLIDLGFSTVLTSGGKNSAMEGKENLKFLVENYSHKIDILIGGGVRSENIEELKNFTGGTHFHSSAIPKYEHFANENEIKKLRNVVG